MEQQEILRLRYQLAEFDELNALEAFQGDREELKERVEQYLEDQFLEGYAGACWALGEEPSFAGIGALLAAALLARIAGKTWRDRLYELPEDAPRWELVRLVFTEGHRVYVRGQEEGAGAVERETGKLVLKRWDATLDGRTRSTHVQLDGQIRRLEEEFETVNGRAKEPGGFGIPEEDVNCRCILSFLAY